MEAKKYMRLKANEYISAGHLYSVSERNTDSDYPVHWHDYFEVELIISGSGEHVINGERVPIKRGTVLFLTPTDYHSVHLFEKTGIINISFSEAAIDDRHLRVLMSSGAPKSFSLGEDELCRLINILGLMSAEANGHGECERELFYCFMTYILRGRTDGRLAVSRLQGIERALLFMELHFRENITLSETAAQAGFHPTYFSELFSKTTGEKYCEYISRLRINYACELLSHGMSVGDACFQSGFGSFSNFQLAFKKKTGVTPGEYRKKHQ